MTTPADIIAARGGHQAIRQRRAVLNACIQGNDPRDLELPPAVIAWHIIWLHHGGLVDANQQPPRHTGRHRTAAA